jgi:hypothetical protein
VHLLLSWHHISGTFVVASNQALMEDEPEDSFDNSEDEGEEGDPLVMDGASNEGHPLRRLSSMSSASDVLLEEREVSIGADGLDSMVAADRGEDSVFLPKVVAEEGGDAAMPMPEPPTQPHDSRYLYGCICSVWMHDPAVSEMTFSTFLIGLAALLRDIENAIEETELGAREQFEDGQELQSLLSMNYGLQDDLRNMLGGIFRKVISLSLNTRPVSVEERALLKPVLRALEAQHLRGLATLEKLKNEDWPKILGLFRAGKGTTVPFILLSVGVGVIDRSLAAIYWNQKAEVMSYLIDMVSAKSVAAIAKKKRGLLSLLLSLFVVRTAQGGISSLESLLKENGVKKFNYDLNVAVIHKLYSIDLSTFETKFKTPGAAQDLAFNKTAHVQAALEMSTGITTAFSGLVATVMILYRKNPKLLLTMLGKSTSLHHWKPFWLEVTFKQFLTLRP